MDLRGLPTEAAWDLGRRSAERLLDLYLLEEGEPLQHLALSVWGTATIRNGGEDIAQLLALLRPSCVGWPDATHGRPGGDPLFWAVRESMSRCACPVCSAMRSSRRHAAASGPDLGGWIGRRRRMNPLAALTREQVMIGTDLGSAPGAYGAGLQALIDSGQWDNRDDLGEAFLEWSQWSYNGAGNPKPWGA